MGGSRSAINQLGRVLADPHGVELLGSACVEGLLTGGKLLILILGHLYQAWPGDDDQIDVRPEKQSP